MLKFLEVIMPKITLLVFLLAIYIFIGFFYFYAKVSEEENLFFTKTPKNKTTVQKSELEDIVKQNIASSSANFGVYIKNLTTGEKYSLNPDESFDAASLYKLAVMYAIFLLDDLGILDVNLADIQTNLSSMITISSNEAAVYLVEQYTSWEEITDTMKSSGLNNTDLTKDTPTTTPSDMTKLLEMISQGKAISLDASIKMLEILSKQKINDRIPSLLPKDIFIAHKTGELGDVRHDVGIISAGQQDYILVLMTKGTKSPEKIKPLMAKISKDIYDYFLANTTN